MLSIKRNSEFAKNTDEDREVLLYYQLVNSRHEMLLGNIEKSQSHYEECRNA
ncbi:hypothetical protein ACEQPO_18655 [Bacillus sp. SL00103]